MDIKSLSAKLSVFGEKASVVSNSLFEKAGKFTGDMLEKTADFTFDKLKTSPYCITNGNAFDEVKEHKNLVFFVIGDRDNTQSKAIVGRMPLQIAKAWQYSATLKVIYAQDFPDLVAAIGAQTPSVSIYRNGALKHMLVGKKLDMFLENFDIFCDWDEVKEVPVTPASAPVQETPAITTEPEKTSTNNP
jgi:hypothetical protein